MGSIVFGGGDVLIPMMYEQYVVRPNTERIIRTNKNAIKIERNQFLTGAGVIRAIPGPVFSVGTYVGGLALQSGGFGMQILGCVIGTVAIFLPSLFRSGNIYTSIIYFLKPLLVSMPRL